MGLVRDGSSHTLLEARHQDLEDLRIWDRDARDGEFLRWYWLVELVIWKTFGVDSLEHSRFSRISFVPLVGHGDPKLEREAFQSGLSEMQIYIETIMTQLAWYKEDLAEGEPEATTASRGQRLTQILERFHAAALAMAVRNRAERAPLAITDEYDVQYLLRALLMIEFSDVRPEERTPSHAGASARVDFLLKPERTVVEVR